MLKIKILLFLFTISCYAFAQETNYLGKPNPYVVLTTENGLPSNYVFTVVEDNKGFIWAGTDKGLCRYNGNSWQVWDSEAGLPSNYIKGILPDNQGGLWLTTPTNSIVYFKDEKIIDSYKLDKVKSFGTVTIINDTVFAIINASGYLNYVKMYFKEGKIHLEYIKANGPDIVHTIEETYLYHKKKPVNSNTLPHSLGTLKDVIYYHNFLIQGNHLFDASIPNKVQLKQPLQGKRTGDDFIVKINNKYYYNQAGLGYCLADSNGNITIENTTSGLSSNTVNHITATKDGTIFIATLGGGINVLEQSVRLKFNTKKQRIRQLQNDGTYFYALEKNCIYRFNENGTNAIFNFKDEILHFCVNGNELVIGDFNFLKLYQIVGSKLVFKYQYPITAGISGIIADGDTYIVSTYGLGLVHWQPIKGILNKIQNNSTSINNIEKFVPLKNGFASCSYEIGFTISNKSFGNTIHFTTKNGLLNNYITTVKEWNDSLLVASKNGLTILHNNKVIRTASYNQGLIGSLIKEIMINKNNEVFIVTEKSVQSYKDGKFKLIDNTSLNIEKEETIQSAILIPETDKIVIGTTKNLFLASLAKDSKIKLNKAILASVTIDKKGYANFDNLTVPFDFKQIVIQLAPAPQYLLHKSTFWFKLNDGVWRPANNALTIELNNLASGTYELFIKQISNNGIETEPELLFTFKVNRPWYLQFWFIALAVAAVTSIIYSILAAYNKRIYKQKLEVYKIELKLEEERKRISRDLHDNMGAYTSALLANVDQIKKTTGESEITAKMQSNASNILSNLRETIWILNNKEVSTNDLSEAFKNYAFSILKNYEHISFNAEENIVLNNKLTATTYINTLKALQEILQNSIKHSRCNTIKYTITDLPNLQITLSDDGKGFEKDNIIAGNGLENIEYRLKEIGFIVFFESSNNGTKYQLIQKNSRLIVP